MKTGFDIEEGVGRWTKGHLTMRSDCYINSEITGIELDANMLESIRQGIEEEVGRGEAANFVEFVSNLSYLEASAFIKAFRQFWEADCNQTYIHQEDIGGDQIAKSVEINRISRRIKRAFFELYRGSCER